MPIGPWELLIFLAVILLFFGARRLPEMGRSLGRGMRESKQGVTGKDEDAPDARQLAATTSSSAPRDVTANGDPVPPRDPVQIPVNRPADDA